MGSLFKSAKLFINDTQVTAPGVYHCYRSYIDSVLKSTFEAKKSWKSAHGFYQDTPPYWDSVDSNKFPTNEGAISRKKLTSESKIFTICGRPQMDLLDQEKLIIPVKWRLEFARQNEKFYIVTEDDKEYIIKIHEALLYVVSYKMSEDYTTKVMNRLKKSQVKYEFTRIEHSLHNLYQGANSVSIALPKNGRFPLRVFFVLQTVPRFEGQFKTNPYRFFANKLTHVELTLNSRTIPNPPLTISVNDQTGKGSYSRLYAQLMKSLGIENYSLGNGITMETFSQGFFIVGLSLSDLFSNDYFPPAVGGSLNMTLKFSEPLNETLCLLVQYEYAALLTIDGNLRPNVTH